MPTYEYECTEGHHFEQIQKMSDAPLTKCPKCGAKAKRRISGGSGLIFKGSGFYITDYGKDGKGPRKESDSSSKGASSESTPSSGGESSAATTSSSSEAKPAETPAPSKAPAADSPTPKKP